MPHGVFSVTSNVDGHWRRVLGPNVFEVHGSVARVQLLHSRGPVWRAPPVAGPVWDVGPGEAVEAYFDGGWHAASVRPDGCVVVAEQPVRPYCLRRRGGADLFRVRDEDLPRSSDGELLRPNVLMFGDAECNYSVMSEQDQAYKEWLAALPDGVRLVVLEIGAGTAIPTIRDMAAFVAEQRKAILVRINPEEPVVRSDVYPSIAVALGARDALSRIDAEIRRAG